MNSSHSVQSQLVTWPVFRNALFKKARLISHRHSSSDLRHNYWQVYVRTALKYSKESQFFYCCDVSCIKPSIWPWKKDTWAIIFVPAHWIQTFLDHQVPFYDKIKNGNYIVNNRKLITKNFEIARLYKKLVRNCHWKALAYVRSATGIKPVG